MVRSNLGNDWFEHDGFCREMSLLLIFAASFTRCHNPSWQEERRESRCGLDEAADWASREFGLTQLASKSGVHSCIRDSVVLDKMHTSHAQFE